jgi:outer membrane lipoprotein-sorting protein
LTSSTAMKIPLLVLCALFCAVNLPAENTETIVARMNEVALTFKGMSANINMTTYTKVIDDKEVGTGTLQVQRLPGKPMRALLNLQGQSDSNEVFLHDNIVSVYTPKLKLVKDYDVGNYSDLLEQTMLLGFGTSGKELMNSYDINNAGTENIAGQETTHLVLLPRSNKVKEKISKVEVWIPVGKASPVQQQYFEPNGNYRITTYSNLILNPPIKKLEFKPPAGTKKQ